MATANRYRIPVKHLYLSVITVLLQFSAHHKVQLTRVQVEYLCQYIYIVGRRITTGSSCRTKGWWPPHVQVEYLDQLLIDKPLALVGCSSVFKVIAEKLTLFGCVGMLTYVFVVFKYQVGSPLGFQLECNIQVLTQQGTSWNAASSSFSSNMYGRCHTQTDHANTVMYTPTHPPNHIHTHTHTMI